MISRIERAYHWFSIVSMAGAIGMVCAGHTAWEPALHGGGEWVSFLYWSVCTAFVVSTAAFAYLALLNAEKGVRALANGTSQLPLRPANARRNHPHEQHVKV